MKTKAFLPLILAAALLPTIFSITAAYAASIPDTSWYDANPGAGTYTVSTAERLAGLALLVNSGIDFEGVTVKLGNDIDLSAYGTNYNSGKGWIPIGEYIGGDLVAEIGTPPDGKLFKGNFDGCGHTISNLYINAPDLNCAGLFGYIGNVKDLGLIGAYVKAQSYVGGIAGIVIGGDIKNCYTENSTVDGLSYVGGIAGNVNSGAGVTNCYATGSVKCGGNWAGGIAGFTKGKISNCYSANIISGHGFTGGIAGESYQNGSITNCVSLNPEVSGDIYTGRVTGAKNGDMLFDNYAFDGMTVIENGTEKTLVKGLDCEDGGDVNTETALTAVFWTETMKWNASVWKIENGKLPLLKNNIISFKQAENTLTKIDGAISGSISYNIKAEKNQGESVVVMAVYDKTGRIVFLKTNISLSVEAGDNPGGFTNVSIPAVVADTYTVKLFLWRSTGTLAPLVEEPVEVSL
jgi:hypothetical protein